MEAVLTYKVALLVLVGLAGATYGGTTYYYQTQLSDLNNKISALNTQVTTNTNQLSDLEAANVNGSFVFGCGLENPYCQVDGAYSNYGTQEARNIVLTLTLHGMQNTVQLGNLPGRTTAQFPEQSFAVGPGYFGDKLSWSFSWTQ